MITRAPYALLVSVTAFFCVNCRGEQTVPSAGADMTYGKGPHPAAPENAKPRNEHPVFITIPRLLEPLKRAPVMFWHDKHTSALKEEGCQACHPQKSGRLEFSFPKDRDETGKYSLMNSFHDSCIQCHAGRARENRKTGPVACGECHSNSKAYGSYEYLPVLTQDKEAINSPRKPEHSQGLNLKRFRVKGLRGVKLEQPEAPFDYYTHDKHLKALDNKCALCHYISPALKQKLLSEGRTPTSQDWLREEEPGRSLKEKKSAHHICLDCHLKFLAEKKSSGPVYCRDCHTGQARSAMQLKDIPRIDCGNRDRFLIKAETNRMAAVPFNHKAHIAASRFCSECHHKTLESCNKCHTPDGSKEGNFINLAEAYHKSGSKRSCIGCHDGEKQNSYCAGCHHLRSNKPAASACNTCHTGSLESLDRAVRLSDSVAASELPDQFRISILENEYEPADLKHREIITRLTDISNNSRLATFFHTKETTICLGCHHKGKIQPCQNCHTLNKEPTGNTPTLMGAYHQQCLGCHLNMKYPEEKMPQKCEGCHKKKKR